MRKILISALISGVCISTGYTKADDQDYSAMGRFTLGASYIYDSASGNDVALIGGILSENYLIQAGVNFERFKLDSNNESINIFELRGLVALRNNLYDNQLYFMYGVNGNYGIRSSSDSSDSSTNPYSVGPVIGLNYQPITNLLFIFAINPYAYSVSPNKTKKNSIFETGSISISYVW